MSQPVQIISPQSTSTLSSVFQVYPGYAMVISSFNFQGEKHNDVGDVIEEGDCAVLHKLKVEHGTMPHGNGCADGECRQCIFEPSELKIVGSEPVILCEETMTHFCGQNLTVLSVPGYYAFELCREKSLGKVSIEVEEITADVAKLIPQNFFHGA